MRVCAKITFIMQVVLIQSMFQLSSRNIFQLVMGLKVWCVAEKQNVF